MRNRGEKEKTHCGGDADDGPKNIGMCHAEWVVAQCDISILERLLNFLNFACWSAYVILYECVSRRLELSEERN